MATLNQPKPELTYSRLRELLTYNPKTGIFRWLVTRNNFVQIGGVAGSLNAHGYLLIQIDRRKYCAHRLAWFYIYRSWPPAELDHKDRERQHNWIGNLRLADRGLNTQNRTRRKDSRSAYKGVTFHKASGRWSAQIQKNYVPKYLGLFDTPQEAYAAYAAAAAELFGEFASIA